MEEEAAQCDKFSELGRAAATHPSSNANSHRVLPPSLSSFHSLPKLSLAFCASAQIYLSVAKKSAKLMRQRRMERDRGEVEMEDEVEFEVEVTRELVTKLAISLYPAHPLSQLKTLSLHSVTL